jgi:RNA polymerase sigma factor (sigma-70 family)
MMSALRLFAMGCMVSLLPFGLAPFWSAGLSRLWFLGPLLHALSAPQSWSGGQGPRVPSGKPDFDEQALIAAAQRGSLPAFNQLILHYQSLSYNVAYRLLGDADSAADATQDGFIKAFQRLDQYRGGSFKAWLLRIITNTCYDALRTRRRRPTSSLEPEDEDSDGEHDGRLQDPAERPDAYVLRKELAAAIQAAIELLPSDQRTALVLADIEGLDYQEIAEVTNSQLGTVKSRLSRARAKMRDMLMAQKELLPAQYRLTDG